MIILAYKFFPFQLEYVLLHFSGRVSLPNTYILETLIACVKVKLPTSIILELDNSIRKKEHVVSLTNGFK